MNAPIPSELLNFVDILSPNESELARLTGMPTESFEQISRAVIKCHEMVSSETTTNLDHPKCLPGNPSTTYIFCLFNQHFGHLQMSP